MHHFTHSHHPISRVNLYEHFTYKEHGVGRRPLSIYGRQQRWRVRLSSEATRSSGDALTILLSIHSISSYFARSLTYFVSEVNPL
ncbi:hypothetical protein L2E82_30296 [Cichorium intybus]|uniref:Uncharacterized protein n=1 Tax=Cichorium intybus TaxID=13427 RepID=A0ACB9CZX7_CICIN|nr:hypothetical protein L2E82_30296 [Cichorium intybus]